MTQRPALRCMRRAARTAPVGAFHHSAPGGTRYPLGMLQQLRKFLGWLGTRQPQVLGAALVVVAGTWGFIQLADEVTEGETQRFDEWAVRVLRNPADLADPLGPPWLEEVGRDITALGGVAILALVTIGVAVYLLLIRKYHAMWLVLAA